MKKLMTAAAAAALLAASSFAAFAAEATGAITSIDVAAGTIVLDDGKTYVVAAVEGSGDATAPAATDNSARRLCSPRSRPATRSRSPLKTSTAP